MVNVKAYLGIPYTLGGQSIEEGFDCWTFVKYFLKKEYDITLDYCPTKEEIESYKEAARWIQSGIKREIVDNKSFVECDLVALKPSGLVMMGKGSYITHIGVYIGNSMVIHCQNSAGGGQVIVWPMLRVRQVYKNLKGFNHVNVLSG